MVLSNVWAGAGPQGRVFGSPLRSNPLIISPHRAHGVHPALPRPSTRTHAAFKRSITTTEIIQAEPAAVWAVLTDFPSYPAWNPLIVAMAGTQPLAAGDKLAFTIELPGGGGGAFAPAVLSASPGRELRWRGSLPVPGLFTGERFIRLIEEGPGATRLVHGEHFWGLLIPAVGDVIERTERGFALMNAALKRRVEES